MTNKKRYYLTLDIDTVEKAQTTAQSLGLTLSQYVNLTLKSLNQGSADEAFSTFFSALAISTKNDSLT